MTGTGLPRSWKEYLDSIDKCLTEKGAPPPVRKGICQDVEVHLRQLAADRPKVPEEDLPGFLDPPNAYAGAYEEATTATPEAKKEQPPRLRECRSHHGEDGQRRIHICANCLRVFQGCREYETHICDGDIRWDGKFIPYWTHQKRWTTAIVVAVCLFVPILWFIYGYLAEDPCGGGRRRYHENSNVWYFKNLVTSIVTFQVTRKREPENLQELAESGIWNGNWVMPGDLEDLGREGGLPVERVYYIHASGMNASWSSKTRQPWLILPHRPHNTKSVCYTVAYTNGDALHYSTLAAFLADWEAKQ